MRAIFAPSTYCRADSSTTGAAAVTVNGSTVWHAARSGSVSGSCGGCRFGEAFYVADAAPGGTIIVRYDVTTGARMYETPVMPGFTVRRRR